MCYKAKLRLVQVFPVQGSVNAVAKKEISDNSVLPICDNRLGKAFFCSMMTDIGRSIKTCFDEFAVEELNHLTSQILLLDKWAQASMDNLPSLAENLSRNVEALVASK